MLLGACLVAQMVKNLSTMLDTWFYPCVGKIPLRRGWLPTSIFLPRESSGQRSLKGYSPWGRKELGMTAQLTHVFALSKKKYPHLNWSPIHNSLLESSSKCLLSLLQNQRYSQLPSLSFSRSLPFSSLPPFVVIWSLIQFPELFNGNKVKQKQNT